VSVAGGFLAEVRLLLGLKKNSVSEELGIHDVQLYGLCRFAGVRVVKCGVYRGVDRWSEYGRQEMRTLFRW